MKKIITLFVFVAIAMTSQAKYVRFAVNMKGSTMNNSNDCYMSSTFQEEIGMGLDLTHGYLHLIQSTADTNIYYATFNVPAFQMYEYQFEMGIAGYDIETIPAESQSPLNGYRWLYVDSTSNDTLQMPAVFYSGNNTATDTMYRFKVNMISQNISANGVHVVGAFQGNNPTAGTMYSFGSGIYEYMAWLSPGTMQHYKFYNGNTSSNGETVPSSCAMGGTRMINSVSMATVLPTVCFNQCDNVCYPLSTSNLTFKDSITLTPNPMINSSVIAFNDYSNLHQISIIDLYGRVVKKYENIQTSTFEINKNGLNTSLYQIQIVNSNNEITSFKLMVE